jgi:hypothetical protein
MAFQLKTGNLDQVFTKFEILCLLTSCVCHDANHDGFTNQYSVNAQTPLGILHKNQSIMETHHCSVSIGIITRDASNIFGKLNDSETVEMWSLFISLILATDMAKHFTLLESARAMRSPEWAKDREARHMMMKLLIKCADLANVARPFELADRWHEILCEEFFRQGDLEKASGMEYSSPMNDREHLDKARSQIGFYRGVCFPLFSEVVLWVEGLQVMVDQLSVNLEKWVERSEMELEREEKERVRQGLPSVAEGLLQRAPSESDTDTWANMNSGFVTLRNTRRK